MGIVIKQSAYASLINYFGVLLGAINTLFLFTEFFTPEQYGLFKTIFSMGVLFAPFAQAGIPRSMVRFFPRFKNSPLAAGRFLFLLFLFALTTSLIFSGLFYLLEEQLFSFFVAKAPEILNYKYLILTLIIIMAFIAIVESYFKTYLNVTFATFMREVFLRLASTILVFCYFLKYISFEQFLYFSVFTYFLSLSFLVIILVLKKKLYFNTSIFYFKKSFVKSILRYMLFIMAGAIGSVIVLQIDQVMISGYEGLSSNSVYVVAFFMATVIEIPRRSITQMSDAIIASAFENERLDQVKKIYKQSSINQFLLGAFVFGIIIINLSNIYAIIPKGEIYEAGKWVVIIIGAAKLIDMVFGVNSEIIISSQYYKYNILFVVILAILTIILNSFFIPMYGLSGAALASLSSIFIFNSLKLLFIYNRFRFFPFSIKTIITIMIASICIISGYFLPDIFEKGILNGIYVGTIYSVLFLILTLLFKPSQEIDQTLKSLVRKIFPIR